MTNEQAAMIAAASYSGSIDAPALSFYRASTEAKAQRICALAKELLTVLDKDNLRETKSG